MDDASWIERLRLPLLDPADRLVLADWLASRGDARGELVLLEHALGGLPPAAERARIRARIEAICVAHRSRWFEGLEQLEGPGFRFDWYGGFIVRAQLMFGAYSWGRTHDMLDTLFRHPTCRFLTKIVVEPTCPVGLECMEALVDRLHLIHVSEVDLRKTYLRDDSLAALMGSPHLHALVELDLRHNAITADGVQAIVDAVGRDALEMLSLTDNALGERGARICEEIATRWGCTVIS